MFVKTSMKPILVLPICIVFAWAQPQGPTSPVEDAIARLQGLADQVKSTLADGDFATASRLATELGVAITQQERALKLVQLEAGLANDGPARFDALPRLATTAYEAGELGKAETYAKELLTLATQYREDRNYGNAIFYGNMVLGRVALRRDKNVGLAKADLIASGSTPGSPTLNSFGPNVSLARDLLEIGERESVLQFFDQCRAFWKLESKPAHKLDEWIGGVKGCCRMPDFGANLVYVP